MGLLLPDYIIVNDKIALENALEEGIPEYIIYPLGNPYLEQLSNASDDVTYALVESHIREEPDGWYFPYQSEKYLLTRQFGDSLVGNWPIFVSRTGDFAGPRRPGMSVQI